MGAFFSGLWTITTIELRQRVRGVAWYILLGVFVVLLLIVTGILTWSYGFASDYNGGQNDSGGIIYSVIIYFVLLLSSLVTPALSGNMVNGDREAGTLATTQVTLVTTPQLVLGKFLAAWISALAFLLAAVPFILWSFAQGGAQPLTVVVSILVLAFELGVVSAIGVGLSGLMRRPLFSVVATYLLVSLLSIGTLIAFALGGLILQTPVTVQNTYVDYNDPDLQFDDNGNPIDPTCISDPPMTTTVPRFDLVWWMLAANPYVVVADASPTVYDSSGYPRDLFGSIKSGVRYAQLPADLNGYDECEVVQPGDRPDTAREVIESTTPSWLVGMLIHLGLAGAALWGAVAVTHAPSRRLAAGSRVA
ncbi:MAG: transporter permease [Schumannella sp.]|nr:transporter permease [Schumannella sp.]